MKGKNRKWLSLILSFFMVLSVSGIVLVAYAPPLALPLVHIDPEENTANPTESFTVNVNVQDVVDLYSYGIKVGFDFNVLSFGGLQRGPFMDGQPGGIFFSFVVGFDHVNVVAASFGPVPGVSGSGTLFSVTFNVDECGTSAIDVFGDTLIDSTLTAIDHDAADGYFYTSARADLVRRSAWPEHHHFVVPKDEDYNGTHANQTLSGKVKNLGPIEIYVRVTFDLVRDDGFVSFVTTEPALVPPGTIVTLSANLLLTSADAGKYYASAQAQYSYGGLAWATGTKNKTFSFAVVP